MTKHHRPLCLSSYMLCLCAGWGRQPPWMGLSSLSSHSLGNNRLILNETQIAVVHGIVTTWMLYRWKAASDSSWQCEGRHWWKIFCMVWTMLQMVINQYGQGEQQSKWMPLCTSSCRMTRSLFTPRLTSTRAVWYLWARISGVHITSVLI